MVSLTPLRGTDDDDDDDDDGDDGDRYSRTGVHSTTWQTRRTGVAWVRRQKAQGRADDIPLYSSRSARQDTHAMASISHASHLGKASSDVRGTHNGLAPLNRPDTESPRECDHDVVLVAPADARKDGELLDNDAGSKVDTPATARPSKSKDSPNPRLSATLPADETHLRPPQTTGTPASSSTVTSHRLTWSEWAIQYRTFLESAGKAIALFLFSLAVLALLLHTLLPPIDPKDRDAVKIPKNFDELQR